MAKAKKVLSTVLVALFTVFTVLSYVPAKAAAGPKINMVAQPNAEYKVGDRVIVKFNSGSYKGIVQYRAFLWKVGYGKVKELYPAYAKDSYFYKPVCVGTSTFTIDVFYATEPGVYEIVVGVKAKGAKASTASYVTTSRFTVKAKETASTAEIKSLEAVSVTVNQNDTAVLPATVKATLADGTTKDVKVTWATVDTSKAGEYTVEGTVEGTTLKATAKVTVKAVELSVKSVAAVAADKFKVVFNTVPQDTSKVVFTVKRETTPVTVTATWNGSEATLTGSVKFAQGNYTVNVKENDKDLGTSNVTIEQEKVAKIEITSDTLGVQTDTSNGTTNQYAYFTYKVYNQYDVDITDSSLASINWIVPSCTVLSNNKGVVKVQATAGLNLFNLGSLTITGIEQNYNVTTSKTLKISATVGTLSDIQLVALKQADNKEFKAGSTADFYIDYVAKDMAGNETKDYTLVSNGLNNGTLTSSANDYVSVSLEDNDGKAVIKVKVLASSITVDMPIVFTAVTTSGKSSSLSATLKKQAAVASFTLLAPTQDIAAGDSAKEIPFVAYDQDGNQITSFDDLVSGGVVEGYKYTTGNGFSISPAYTAGGTGLYFVKKADGTAKLMYKPVATATQDTTAILTATTTTTGKYSQLSIVVRKPAVASSFTIDTASLVTKFQKNAEYDIDNGIFTIKDQYGRDMDISANAYIKAEPQGTTTFGVVNAGAAKPYTYGTSAVNDANNDLIVKAPATAGSYSIKFTLVNASGDVTSKTVTFTVLDDSDIKGLTTGTVGKLYTTYNTTGWTDINNVYDNKVQIFGKTSSGEKVVLNKVAAFDLGWSNNKITTVQNYATTNPCDYNKINLESVYQFDSGVTSGDTVVTATTIIGTDVKSVSFTVTVSNDKPIAQSIKADDELSASDTITDDIVILDQYGKNLMKRNDWDSFVTLYVKDHTTGTVTKVTSAQLGTTLSSSTIGNIGSAGDIVTIVTSNGFTQSFVIK